MPIHQQGGRKQRLLFAVKEHLPQTPSHMQTGTLVVLLPVLTYAFYCAASLQGADMKGLEKVPKK